MSALISNPDNRPLVTSIREKVDLEIDYTTLYLRMANSLEELSKTLATTSNHCGRIADATEKLSDSTETISKDIEVLRSLGETTGIRTVSPYVWINLAFQFMTQAGILETLNSLTADEIRDLKTLIQSVSDQLNDLQRFQDK
jgi:archaellum component FlaC